MKRMILIALLITGISKLWANGGFVVGQPCPDFEVRNMDYYTHKTFHPKQVRGKWLFLNFFAMGCTANFSGLAKLDSLQGKLSKQLKVVMIGKNKPFDEYPATQLKTYYDEYQKKYHYRMAAGYDSSLFTRFNLTGLPIGVLVDPGGMVRAVFMPNSPTLVELEDFIRGKRTSMPGDLQKFKEHLALQLDWNAPLLIRNNGLPEDSFLSRSVFTERVPVYALNPVAISGLYGNRVQIINRPITTLFYYAYGDTTSEFPYDPTSSYGKISQVRGWDWQLTAADSQQYMVKEYCYSITLPKAMATTENLQEALRDDLKRCFGLVARIETRQMPCYVLVNKGDPNRFATKGNALPNNGDYQVGTFHMRNVPMHYLVKQLWGRYRTKEPIIDETGITGNLDIDFNSLYYDPLPEAIKALQAIQLDLIKTTRPIKVIVIGRAGKQSPARGKIQFVTGECTTLQCK